MSEPFLGEIQLFAGNFAPRGYMYCNGQLLPISQNSALFSLLGTEYGGDGRTTFGLPDLRGRVPINYGQGPGLSNYQIGDKGGVENVTLNVNQIPSHTHMVNASDVTGESTSPAGNVWAAQAALLPYASTPTVTMGANAIANSGGSLPHSNIIPYTAVSYIIATVGIFPSRN